jgi:aminopeptidase N
LGEDSGETWRTPVVIAAPGGPPIRALVTGETSDQQPRLVPGAIVNAGQTGYFRTAYDAGLWRPFAQRFATLAPVDQLGLIYDSRSLGEAGVAPIGNFLDLATRVDPAADPVVLSALVSQLTAFDDHYEGRPGQASYRAFALARLRPVLARLTWDARPGEPDNAAVARAAVLKAMGRFGDETVIAEARRRFAAWRAQPEVLSGSGRDTVLTIVARQADADTWDQLHAAARAAAEPVEKARLYRLLGAARDSALAERALALALGGEPPATVVPSLIRAVAQVHPDRAFEFALANRAAVEAALEPASRPSFIASLANGSRSLRTAERVEAFAALALPASAQPEAAKSVSAIRFRAEVIDKRLPDVDRWLAARPAG